MQLYVFLVFAAGLCTISTGQPLNVDVGISTPLVSKALEGLGHLAKFLNDQFRKLDPRSSAEIDARVRYGNAWKEALQLEDSTNPALSGQRALSEDQLNAFVSKIIDKIYTFKPVIVKVIDTFLSNPAHKELLKRKLPLMLKKLPFLEKFILPLSFVL